MAGVLSHFNGNPIRLSLSKSNSLYRPSFYRPVMVTMAQTQTYWAAIESDIEAHLKKAIPVRPPLSVFEPMHHLAFAAPRTKAPALCIAACELVGGHRDQAVDAASALHLMHSASHAHENLPLTDRPTEPTRPTIHHAYGPNIELLTGDGIVPFGLELLARSVGPVQNNPDRVLRVIVEITRAIGSQGMVDGQYRETKGTQSNGEWMEHVCKKKEGELHGCGAACGAILGGGSEEEIEKLRKFGVYVGMIQGILHRVGGNEKGLMEEVERLRVLALKELDNFKGRKVEPISSLVEPNLCNV